MVDWPLKHPNKFWYHHVAEVETPEARRMVSTSWESEISLGLKVVKERFKPKIDIHVRTTLCCI